MTTAIDDAAPGSVLANRYRVERKLGEGGFATVYLATHLEVASLEVAIKVLRSAHRARTRIIEGFRREASLLAMLRNRHTVRLIDFGLTEDDRTFIAMEFVRGIPLDRVLLEQGALTVADAARIGIGVLKSLVEAHSVGVIHQDLKPANIVMVSEPGERYAAPRVLDFGIARVLGERDPAGPNIEKADATETIFCTPAYAAPELLRGKPDYRTDLYALGLVMAEMIEGIAPYDFEGITASRSPHLSRDPIPFGDATLHGPLGPIIAKACAKRVKHRFADAQEMLHALEEVYETLSSEITRETRVVVAHNETVRPPIDKPEAVTSQFVQTQSWLIDRSKMEHDEDSGLHDLRPFPVTETVNPLEAHARKSAMRRAAPDPEAAHATTKSSGSQLIAIAVRKDKASSDFDDDLELTPVGDTPLPPPRAVPDAAPHQKHKRAASPAPSTPPESSRSVPGSGSVPMPEIWTPGFDEAHEVRLFGSTVKSTRVSWIGVVIVISAIVVPALITGWSVYRWHQAERESAQPMIVPITD